MKTTAMAVLIVAAGIFGGCASHGAMQAPVADFHRANLLNQEQARQLEQSLTDTDIARLLDVRVQAKLPTSLAVARLRSHCSGYQPYLDQIDAQELNDWEALVKGQPQITGVQPITGFQIQGESLTLHSLRTAAAQLHCELLLVYIQADSELDNFNDAAVLYWSIAGLWVVPGNQVEHKTVAQAVLLDCRTGMILGTATGDHHAKRICPAAFVDQRKTELSKESQSRALADLQTACRALVTRTVAAATAAALAEKRK
jgi:hypothetical protein